MPSQGQQEEFERDLSLSLRIVGVKGMDEKEKKVPLGLENPV